MAKPHSLNITIISEVYTILHKIKSSGLSEKRHVERSELILRLSGGGTNIGIAKEYEKNSKTVKRWRLRYLSYQDRFAQILLQPDKVLEKRTKELSKSVYEMLSDASRSGTPMKFTPVQYCKLLNISTQPPSTYNREISDWTPRELRDEVVKQGIFESISVTQVRSFLKRS